MRKDAFFVARNAGHIVRLHTVRGANARQTIAAHSWGVAMLVMAVAPTNNAAMVRAALLHDVPEIETGDIPAPAKWHNEDLSAALRRMEDEFLDRYGLHVELTPAEEKIVKWCDTAELVLHSLECVEDGNDAMIAVLHNAMVFLRNIPRSTAEMNEVYEWINEKVIACEQTKNR